MFSVNWGIVAAHGSLHSCIPERTALDNDTSGNHPGNGLWPFHSKAIMGQNGPKFMYCQERTSLSSTAVNPKLFS